MNNSSAKVVPGRLNLSGSRMEIGELLIWCIVNGVLSFSAIFGNSLIILSFVRFKKLRTRTNYFIVGLAVADFLVGLISMPMWIASMITVWLRTTSWMRSVLYRAFLALDAFAGISSILHLMLISLERMFAIGWPIYHRVSSRNSYLAGLAIVWGLALMTFSLFIPKTEISMIPRFYVLFVLFVIPLLVTVATYIAIWWTVRHKQHDTNYWSQNREVKLAGILFLVSVLFVVAWLPFMVVNTVLFFCGTCRVNSKVIYFVKLLHYSNSSVNAALYSYRISDFKRAFLTILRRRKWKQWRDGSLKSSVDLRNTSRSSSTKNPGSIRASSESKPLTHSVNV
ncbi:5-hydroxytryptamine receptor 2B isoform X2 [Nematostella vectensis]|nr:5-hydroxytryptamine receptor 2B isoform X2 [Nematostella vectensis]XP_048586470.1 5-hydroxytryptamine receptor 2B isoform X2 [Nematostella vectensis]